LILIDSRPASKPKVLLYVQSSMSKLSRHRVLLAGILSPAAALLCYELVYEPLTAFSKDLQSDWLFRLSVATPAMLIPFLFTLWLVFKERRRGTFSLSAKIGLVLATLSLSLMAKPMHDGFTRAKQEHNLALRDVPAPVFETLDISGNPMRLADHAGQVVLVNRWATWCVPCRAEMPNLDRLYQTRKDQGLLVVGISDEDIGTQRKFLEEIPVTYPLLTLSGNMPALYRDIARYPAIFLIDRNGRLQPAPPPGQPFEKLEIAVDILLHRR